MSENNVKNQEEEIILVGFDIKKGGLKFEYTTIEPMKKGALKMNGERITKSPYPPTHEILKQADRLRISFAKACAMWSEDFDVFVDGSGSLVHGERPYDGEVWDKANATIEAIHIEKVKIGEAYQITASVESIEGKFIRVTSPKITEDDLVFNDLHEIMKEVTEVIKEFIKDSKYDIKAEAYEVVYRSIRNKEERLEIMNSMTERDILLNAIDILEEKGALLCMDPELDKEIMDMRKEKEMEESVNALKSVEVEQDDLTDMGEAESFANTNTVHESHQEKHDEQDWAVAEDNSSGAEVKEVIEEEFM